MLYYHGNGDEQVHKAKTWAKKEDWNMKEERWACCFHLLLEGIPCACWKENHLICIRSIEKGLKTLLGCRQMTSTQAFRWNVLCQRYANLRGEICVLGGGFYQQKGDLECLLQYTLDVQFQLDYFSIMMTQHIWSYFHPHTGVLLNAISPPFLVLLTAKSLPWDSFCLLCVMLLLHKCKPHLKK